MPGDKAGKKIRRYLMIINYIKYIQPLFYVRNS